MIDVQGLTKSFRRDGRDLVVLDDVSLRVETGEIGGVIGRSGAGKSTLARCVNLLEQPTSGAITVDGRDLAQLADRDLQTARRRIGTIFQAAHLLSGRTVSGNVALPLELAGVPREERRRRVAELVARVGLADHADVRPAELSGGQRQRVGIARALALEPSVLLADEATSGLDPETTTQILDLLRTLRDDLCLTILLITHEMEVVRDVCDRVTLLKDGRVAESGRLADLVLDPDSTIGRALVPVRPVAAAHDGDATWHVRYGSAATDPGWLHLLQQRIGAPVALLGAAVEAVDGRLAGHVTIGVPASAGDLEGPLADLGLHGRRGAHAPVEATVVSP